MNSRLISPSDNRLRLSAFRIAWVRCVFVSYLVAISADVFADGPGVSHDPVIVVNKLPLKTATTFPAAAGKAPLVSTGLTVNFRGIDDSNLETPADPIIAAGPNHVVQAGNAQFRITDKAGTTLATVDPQVLFSAFYADPNNADISGPFDPWAVYDHFAGRFVIVWDTLNTNEDKGYFLIQVSNSSDPTQGWTLFSIRSDLDGNTDTASWGDYEKLGFDNTNFYLTSNQFASSVSSNGQFTYAKVRVMSKAQFYNSNNNGIQYWDFTNFFDAQFQPAFTVLPCLTFGNPGKEYLVSAPDGQGSYLSLYSITGTWPNAQSKPPVLKVEGKTNFTAWTFPGYMFDPAGDFIDGSDGRLLNAVYRNGSVYTGHSIGTSKFSCAAGIKSLNVSTRAKGLDEVIGKTGEYFAYPVVTVDANNTVYTVFNRSSSKVFAEARWTVKKTTDATFQTSRLLQPGNANYDGYRWGDYNGIALDPADGSVWINSMVALTNSTGGLNYGTWVGDIPAGGGSPPPPTFSNVTVSFANGTLTVNGDDSATNLDSNITMTYKQVKVSGVIKSANVTVTANDANSLINSQSSPVVLQVGVNRFNVNAAMGDGNDSVTFNSFFSSTVNVDLGPGDDTASFLYNSIYTLLAIDGGTGSDVVTYSGNAIVKTTTKNVP